MNRVQRTILTLAYTALIVLSATVFALALQWWWVS